jgi:hypothetical protein
MNVASAAFNSCTHCDVYYTNCQGVHHKRVDAANTAWRYGTEFAYSLKSSILNSTSELQSTCARVRISNEYQPAIKGIIHSNAVTTSSISFFKISLGFQVQLLIHSSLLRVGSRRIIGSTQTFRATSSHNPTEPGEVGASEVSVWKLLASVSVTVPNSKLLAIGEGLRTTTVFLRYLSWAWDCGNHIPLLY